MRGYWLGALDHQDVPFERLVEVLDPERSLARHPLFQVRLTVQNTAPAVLELPGLQAAAVAGRDRGGLVRPADHPGRDPRRRGAGGTGGAVTVAADLFDAARRGALGERLVRVLAAVAADPGARLCQVQVLDRAEREQLLTGWNDTAAAVPAARCRSCSGRRRRRTPDAVAVSAGRCMSVTGSWMRGRGGWRGHLRGAGAGPERVVAVVMERSVELVTALLGVLKAGAAYLPVDPGYPAERVGLDAG